MKKQQKIEGKIRYVSLSPHGDPEGAVLENGAFVKIPPHSLVRKELIVVGAKLSGTAELLVEEPNEVFHHVRLSVNEQLVADDSHDKDQKEKLKEKHKADLKKREDAPSTDVRMKGNVVAVGTKPKGEVDRLILEDGTSVHLGKDIDLAAEDVNLGDTFEIVGEARKYGKALFVKAESVRQI